MSKNTLWSVAYGDYDLAIDRATLTYRLADTRTGTVWADGLSIGWIEFEDRVTGGLSRYDFGRATLFSLSEKAGPQGKEALFGLDCLGVPIDVYFTCAEREIKLTVEANRDSKTHRVSEVCLLPGLCAVPDDGASYLVAPNLEGALVLARDAPEAPQFLRIWQDTGLSMPFFGAVRDPAGPRSTLAFLTDSAYGSLRLARTEEGGATLDAQYRRDPERRRLELRVLPLPGADYVGIARAYREKIVGERQHVLLRRKARERPEVDTLLGGANITFPICLRDEKTGEESYRQSFADVAEVARDLSGNLGVERALCVFQGWSKGAPDRTDILPARPEAGGDSGMRQATSDIRALGFLAGARDRFRRVQGEEGLGPARRDLPEIKRRYDLNAYSIDALTAAPLSEDDSREPLQSRWDDMDRRMDLIALAHEYFPVFGSEAGCDWSAIVCDYWEGVLSDPYEAEDRQEDAFGSVRVPLYAAVYHDAVVGYPHPSHALRPERPKRFLRSLRALCPPCYVLDKVSYLDPATGIREYVRRTCAVLAPLHRLSFPAFLAEHRFLTPDFAVEEARYSNGARVLINIGDAPFETEEIALPPLGFLAAHPQFVAHDALRLGNETFSTRAWRVARSGDDKPLTESQNVRQQEFPV